MRIIIELDANESTNLFAQIAGAVPSSAIGEAIAYKLHNIVSSVPSADVPLGDSEGAVGFRVVHPGSLDRLIPAIKAVRFPFGMGRREAKDFVELGHTIRVLRSKALQVRMELQAIGVSSDILP